MRDDVANILDCMDVKACEKGSEGGGEDPKATKDSRGGIEECACRSEDYNMCFEGSSMKMGGGGEQRVGWEGRKGIGGCSEARECGWRKWVSLSNWSVHASGLRQEGGTDDQSGGPRIVF